MKKFRFIAGFICGALIFGSIGVFASSTINQITAELRSDLPLYINGEKLSLENGAIFYKDVNYLSLREVAEASGLDVFWNPDTQEIELNSINEKDDENLNNDIVGNETETELYVRHSEFAKRANELDLRFFISVSDGDVIFRYNDTIVKLSKTDSVYDSEGVDYTNINIVRLVLPDEEINKLDKYRFDSNTKETTKVE